MPIKTVSKEYLLYSLKSLSLTQRDMQTLSLYILSNKTYEKEIIECFEFVYNRSNIFHKLLLYYICNEILQNEKRYHSDIFFSFNKFVTKKFKNDLADSVCFEELNKKFVELKRVWESKGIFKKGEFN